MSTPNSNGMPWKPSFPPVSNHQFSSTGIDISPTEKNIRVLVLHDHLLIRAGLCAVLNASTLCRVVGEAGDIATMIRILHEHKPDVVILGWNLSQQDDMSALLALSAFEPSVGILVYGVQSDSTGITRAMQLGVKGILSSETTSESLCDAIRRVVEGQYVIGQAGMVSLVQSATGPKPQTAFQRMRHKYGITRREYEVISELVAGYSSGEIAQRLSLSTNTLKHHMSHIFDKLGVANRLELVLFAVHHGIASDRPEPF